MIDHHDLSMNRRSALKCMAWAGTGVLWSLVGGIPKAFAIDDTGAAAAVAASGSNFHFVQISDSHIGFNKPANPDTAKTLTEAVDKIKAMSVQPSLVLHTGDITHLSKAEQFDTADQILKGFSMPVHYVPGEHDTQDEGEGKLFLERYGKGTKGTGWYSFDDHGVHFVALINVLGFQPGKMTSLGADQLKWLADDLSAVSSSTPIVVFAHIPLWTISEPWGWGTEDAAQAIALLKRFGSVTVLNGHIHQVMQKVEGNISFYTARATAYPQPAPGTTPDPGPLKVPDDQLRDYLGVRSVDMIKGNQKLAITDSTLSGKI